MTKNKPKTDINFEHERWKAANRFGDAVAKNLYKDPAFFFKQKLCSN